MPAYDYIVVGSGIAGLYTAILAQQAGRVLVITKGTLEECNTWWAQGGIAAAIGPGDTTEIHLQDTENAGAGLNDPETTRILAEDAPDRIADLIGLGVSFDTVDGEIALAREGAHRVPRVLHVGGDATGAHIETALATRLNETGIEFREYSLLADIRTAEGAVQRIRVFDSRSRTMEEIEAAHVVLATGGAGQLFKFTTNSDVVTGDGVATAFRAGAEMMDMEFFQFHPTALRLPGAPAFLISEAVRGEGGILRDLNGRAFMTDYDPKRDLAARDVVARAIVREMRRQGNDHVYLDVTHLPATRVATRFPQIYQFCLQHKLDITTSLIPVAPSAHYMMGGIKVNSWGETNVRGLLATGETSCTGAHGANRLASNSLLESLVFSKRLVDRTCAPAEMRVTQGKVRIDEHRRIPTREVDLRRYFAPTMTGLRELMWEKVGIERDGHGLKTAVDTLAAWQHLLPDAKDRAGHELRNAVTAGRLIAEAALYRTESRGAHYRSDFPATSPEWAKHVLWSR